MDNRIRGCTFALVLAAHAALAGNLDPAYVAYMNAVTNSRSREEVVKCTLRLAGVEKPEQLEDLTQRMLNPSQYVDRAEAVVSDTSSDPVEYISAVRILTAEKRNPLGETFLFIDRNRHELLEHPRFSRFLGNIDLLCTKELPITPREGTGFPMEYRNYFSGAINDAEITRMETILEGVSLHPEQMEEIPYFYYLLEAYINAKYNPTLLRNLMATQNWKLRNFIMSALCFASKQELIRLGIDFAREDLTRLSNNPEESLTSIPYSFFVSHADNQSVQMFVTGLLLNNPGRYYSKRVDLIKLLRKDPVPGLIKEDWDRRLDAIYMNEARDFEAIQQVLFGEEQSKGGATPKPQPTPPKE